IEKAWNARAGAGAVKEIDEVDGIDRIDFIDELTGLHPDAAAYGATTLGADGKPFMSADQLSAWRVLHGAEDKRQLTQWKRYYKDPEAAESQAFKAADTARKLGKPEPVFQFQQELIAAPKTARPAASPPTIETPALDRSVDPDVLAAFERLKLSEPFLEALHAAGAAG
ncbi:MAG: hypothetical protein H7287_12565, partial [Thermoleophilia bacterium]|nr:hypothetical protein [Thermoleophilia bacterium]